MKEKKSPLQMPEKLILDMNEKLPGNLTMSDIKVLFKGRPFKIIVYLSPDLMETDVEYLELSVRSTNALRRAGFFTVGDVVTRITSYKDLERIRNCGKTSVSEIMGRLFFYQYSLIPSERRNNYLFRILSINGIKSI